LFPKKWLVQSSEAEVRFQQAIKRLHASPIKKLKVVGPWRYLRRHYARLFETGIECKAELFFGETMTVVLPEVISQQIYTYGFFDELVTGMVLRAVGPGDVVFDIGGHFGYFTVLSSHLVGESGRVVSFEPTPSTFSLLQKNTATLKNVTPLNMGAAHRSGRLMISDFGLSYSAWNTLSATSRMPNVLAQPTARVEVEVVRLDDWCEQESIRPTVIKIDAENFESEVINGLRETLSRSHPRVLMEAGSEQAVQAARVLLSCDYRVLVSHKPGVLELPTDGVEDALLRNKDVLFVPAAQLGKFIGSA
jgi:FkbM family methyltransferase